MANLLPSLDLSNIQQNVIIGIGISAQNPNNIIQATKDFAHTHKSNLKIILVGAPDIESIMKEINFPAFPSKETISYIKTQNPEQYLIEEKKFHAIIRGGLSSSTFLTKLKAHTGVNSTFRLALLETAHKDQFFYAPVGIDESNTPSQKKNLIQEAITFYKLMGIIPTISILSGGRAGDIGRDPYIDKNIIETEQLSEVLHKNFPSTSITHHHILIEKAVEDKSNIIVAPEGISGNLIYRTLVHLGGGKAFGAIYLSILNKFGKIVIDTSRVAEISEYTGALLLSSSIFTKLKNF